MNRGNFFELFKVLCQYDPEIKQRLDELPANAKMMSPDSQNDLLETAASLQSKKIRAELHAQADTYYAILAEYKGHSKKELIAVCVRYIFNGNLRERAVGFVATDHMTSSGIANKILEVLEPLQLDPELCVGFSFDGAAVTSGGRAGVQVLLEKTFPHAVYVRCHSHRLNLVLSTASKVATFFDVINLLHHFMTGANRHAQFLQIQKELHPNKPCLEPVRSTDIRWSSKSESVSRVLTLYDVILKTLSEFAEGSGQTKIEEESLLQHIQRKRFIFLLVAFSKLFNASDFATKAPSVSVTDCVHMIEGLK
ncbi:zinc finger MYM-type protein 1-like [Onychostoma macrolepis]|uniref:zinc finger MYM-type protein 1-like n=1 Tax=Onychostoma macrolepis TaxID=369639 RepID=UPI00272D388A|nr:zinc finger MYM-type protein 1-like [Onychostoma macrolepis]